MSDETNISQWIPVLGTLGGALLGFFASFFTALFTKSREAKQQREERNRQRIERIYELLIVITRENRKMFVDVIKWVDWAKPIKLETYEGIPPLIELEMLVSLYFNELESQRQRLMSSVQEFGGRFINVQSEDFRPKDKTYKQQVAGEFFVMNRKVNNEIEAFKSMVSEIVKP